MLLHPAASRTAEGHEIARKRRAEVVVSLRIEVGISVTQLIAPASVRGRNAASPDKFPSVCLEAVDADVLDQIAPLFQKPVRRLAVGKVQKQRIAEPCSCGQAVGTAALGLQNVALPGRIDLITHGLRICLHVIFEHRNLPENAANAVFMELLHHAPGIRPAACERKVLVAQRVLARYGFKLGIVEGIKGLLVAPRLDDDHTGGDLRFQRRIELLEDLRLPVPLVCGDPRAEGPHRRKRGVTGRLGIGRSDLRVVPREEMQRQRKLLRAAQMRLDDAGRVRLRTEVKAGIIG